MHFSIPDTQECSEGSGSPYIGYKLNINGEYHCTVRYRQLHSLNDLLKRICEGLPHFPPKKYWPLSANQIEERRSLLEKYIQTVGQNPVVNNTEIFNKFLLTAQQESSQIKVQPIVVDVYLMNGCKISVNCNSNESTDPVLQKVCEQINLPLTYMYYFSLFLVKKEESGDITILRKLQDFESPYISQKTIPGSHKLMLRKSYWDLEYDFELMSDKVGLNLLYVQTVSDLERGWIHCPKEVQPQLASLQATGHKKQYVEVARRLKYYGYTQFRECGCNYPEAGGRALVRAGQTQLCLEIRTPSGGTVREASFKVTKIRCWRITTHNDVIESEDEVRVRKKPELELSFEYLVSKDRLEWVTISSEQAILISVCLQSMVDELLIKKAGAKIKQKGEYTNGNFNYLKRDGSSQVIAISQSSSADTLSNSTSNGSVRSPERNEGSISMRRLSEKLSGLSSKSANKTQPLVENDAFEGIGDDDL